MRLLKNLVPALRPGARIVINDHCLREPGEEKPWDEKLIRGMDLIMLTLLNAQEREENEFRALFREADERFVFKVSLVHRLPRVLLCGLLVSANRSPGHYTTRGEPNEHHRGGVGAGSSPRQQRALCGAAMIRSGRHG